MSASLRWVRARPALTYVRVLGVIVILSFALSGYAVVKQSQDAAARQADRRAASTTQVARCYQQVKDSPDVLKTLGLIDALASSSIEANHAALDVSAPDDPLRAVRIASLRRLEPARASLRRLIRRASESAPAQVQCDHLAADLGIDPSRLKQSP